MIPRLIKAATLVVAGAACTTTAQLDRAIATAVVPAERPIPYPVAEAPGFARAVARGTRTRSGEPGPNYWQQYARYAIAGELDPGSKALSGSARVTYYNRSPDTLRKIIAHLYQNIHRPDAERNDRAPVTTGMSLLRAVINGDVLAPLDTADTTGIGVRVYGTIAHLQLPRVIAPGDSASLEFSWSFPVPPAPNIRMGQDGEVFHLAYWYPQIAVYDDINGWDTDQYLGDAEFYMGYADYDVALTVPAAWIVSATGALVNASEVLPERVRSRLAEARRTGEIVHVVAAGERGAGSATAAGERLTWRFTARNVRDFAWNASNRYVWDATRAIVGSSDTVMVHALYRPGTRTWDRAAEFGRHSIDFLSRHLWPYPWPHMTSVEGIITGGMEFPMITLIGSPARGRDSVSLYSVTNHEYGHMWFPMIVGSNERAYTWIDEGLTTFNQIPGMQEFFPAIPRDSLRRDRYIPLARTGTDAPLMIHGDLYPFERARAVAGYDKPAKVFHALRGMLGDEVFFRALREFGRHWAYKHPTPWDLFNTFNEVSGRDLGWFWRTWFYETWPLDQAIGSVRRNVTALAVRIDDRGLAPMPVRLAITLDDGTVERMEIPVDTWLAGRRSHVLEIPRADRVTAIEIDPEHLFPDIDRSNQRWSR